MFAWFFLCLKHYFNGCFFFSYVIQITNNMCLLKNSAHDTSVLAEDGNVCSLLLQLRKVGSKVQTFSGPIDAARGSKFPMHYFRLHCCVDVCSRQVYLGFFNPPFRSPSAHKLMHSRSNSYEIIFNSKLRIYLQYLCANYDLKKWEVENYVGRFSKVALAEKWLKKGHYNTLHFCALKIKIFLKISIDSKMILQILDIGNNYYFIY